MFSLATFVAIALVDFFWVLKHLEDRVQVEDKFLAVRWPVQNRIQNMRVHWDIIQQDSYGHFDRFVIHFQGAIFRLEQTLHDAAENKVMRATNEHFMTREGVLEAFKNDVNKKYAYTWPISSDEGLFDDEWLNFFLMTHDLVANREINEVQALLVFDREEDRETIPVAKLLDYFQANEHMTCRIVAAKEYAAAGRDSQMPPNDTDFGIFGTTMLYISENYSATGTVGTFSKNSDSIDRYRKFFDTIWASPVLSSKNPSECKTPVSVQEILDAEKVN